MAWNISEASYVNQISLRTPYDYGYRCDDIKFNPDGTIMFVLSYNKVSVIAAELSTAWDITTASNQTSISTIDAYPTGFCFSSDGTDIYIINKRYDRIRQWKLSKAWDISTASYCTYKTISTCDTTPTGMNISADGTKLYMAGQGTDKLYQMTMTTAWDLATLVVSNTKYLSFGSNVNVSGLSFSADGTKLYTSSLYCKGLQQYNLTTAWDIETASYSQIKYSYYTDSVWGTAFNAKGTIMFMVDNVSDTLMKYTMPAPYVAADFIPQISIL